MLFAFSRLSSHPPHTLLFRLHVRAHSATDAVKEHLKQVVPRAQSRLLGHSMVHQIVRDIMRGGVGGSAGGRSTDGGGGVSGLDEDMVAAATRIAHDVSVELKPHFHWLSHHWTSHNGRCDMTFEDPKTW